MEMTNINNIPADKFKFAQKSDLGHDSKFDTKPVSYFQGAFRRFAKNPGAVFGGIVIIFLVLFAIIAPFFTPFTPSYYDQVYGHVPPKNNIAVALGVDFWDGYRAKESSENAYLKDLALATETGRDIIKNGKFERSINTVTILFSVLASVSIRPFLLKSLLTSRDIRTKLADRYFILLFNSPIDPRWRRTSTTLTSITLCRILRLRLLSLSLRTVR